MWHRLALLAVFDNFRTRTIVINGSRRAVDAKCIQGSLESDCWDLSWATTTSWPDLCIPKPFPSFAFASLQLIFNSSSGDASETWTNVPHLSTTGWRLTCGRYWREDHCVSVCNQCRLFRSWQSVCPLWYSVPEMYNGGIKEKKNCPTGVLLSFYSPPYANLKPIWDSKRNLANGL